jgi:cholesterol oxidase
MENFVEAVVIGSGFGGAINACRLAKKWPGKVVVLERGRRYGLGEFPRSPGDFSKNFWALTYPHARAARPRRIQQAAAKSGGDLHGLYDVRNYSHLDVVVCAGLGGGSLIYANVFLIPPDQVWNERWPASCQKAVLLPYYEVVKSVLGSRPIPINGDPRRRIGRTRLFERAAAAVNRHSQLVDINVFFGNDFEHPTPIGVQELNRYGALQTSCAYCGECIAGCNYHAKNTLDLNYLHAAEHKHGADIRTDCLATRIVPLNERGDESSDCDGRFGYHVHYRQLIKNQDEKVKTRRVILSAGALGSTEMLLRCKMKFKTLPRISDQIGQHYSANGDFLSFVLEGFEGYPNYGPTITQATDYNLFHEFDVNRAFLVEDVSFPSFLGWFVEGVRPRWMWWNAIARSIRAVLKNITSGKSPGVLGAAFSDLLTGALSPQSATLICMGLDSGSGQMSLDSDGDLWIEWPWRDNRDLYDAIIEAGKAFRDSIGAKSFAPLPTWDWPIRNNVTVHSLGGCVLAETPKTGVTDANRHFGAVFGYEGLYVADGAIVPTAVGANPSATISALSEMVAHGITNLAPTSDICAP